MFFEERLTGLRESRGLTQDNVADAVNLSRPAYANYENGFRRPPYETLVDLARYFDVTTDYLLGVSENPTPPPEIDPPLRRLIDCYRAADKRGQTTITEFALRESLRYGQG